MKSTILAALAVLALAGTAASQGMQNVTVREETPGLLKQAKVSSSDAIAAAQAKVPKATLKSAVIQQQEGKLVYSFDFETPGAAGSDQVKVDAMTGAVMALEHKTPAPDPSASAKPPR
jgi:uncharacterized membrane protein YkoI